MYFPEISVFAPREIQSLTADLIRAGIEQRLELLTYLFCPEQESEPEEILNSLCVETTESQELKIRWRPRMRYPTRAYKFGDQLIEQIKMNKFAMQSYSNNDVAIAAPLLDSWEDGVGFCQGYTRDDMGWPVAFAAATAIAEKSGGVIVTSSYGWYLPSGNEVRLLFNPDGKDKLGKQ